MDQIKPILQGVVQYRFWVICAILVPLLAGGWYTTTARLKDETGSGKSRIEGSYGRAQSVISKANHPNDPSLAGMDRYVAQLNEEVFNSWEHMYRQQEEILVWPEELGEEFIKEVEHLRPIEVVPYPTPQTREIRRQFRENYRDYIKQELPKLADIIGANWQPSTAAGGAAGMGMGMGMEEYGSGSGFGGFGGFGGESEYAAGPMMPGAATSADADYVVLWDASDQSALQNSRFDWSRLPDKVPRTLDILYSQEDLWVLKALMHIIAKTNYDATGNYNATIKQIKYINLGKNVGSKSGAVARVRDGGAGGGTDMMMGGGMGSMEDYGSMDMDMMMMSGDPSLSGDASEAGASPMGPGGPMMGSPDPAHNRYVDNDYQPVSATALRDALTSETRDPSNAYLVVAKRIPIRMSLVMDQRRIHRLIAACGNSSLMVEVRQVRVNKTGGSNAGGGGGGGQYGGFGGMIGMEAEGEEGYGDMMDTGYGDTGGMMGMMAGAPGGDQAKVSYDIPVEVYGMVYIYNPVDTDKLGIEKVEAGSNPLEGGTDPTVEAPAEGGPAPLTQPPADGAPQPAAPTPDAAAPPAATAPAAAEQAPPAGEPAP